MSLSIGIVGLPNVGKSTLFQTLTKKEVDRQNYPFCTIDPNVGVVVVPDERVNRLTNLTHSAKKIYTVIEFVDIAGLVAGANKGEGLGNKFLAHIREVDAIVYVLRAFENDKIINTQKNINPIEEKETLDLELILKDLETINKLLEKLERDVKTNNKKSIQKFEALKQIKKFLEQGKILSEINLKKNLVEILKEYQLLSLKPRLYLLNGNENEIPEEILKNFQDQNWPYLILNIKNEFESNDLTEEDRIALGLDTENEIEVLIKKAYTLLDLITFFTTGPDETRAWTVVKGSTAPQAAGVIHSDFEQYFIRAEVINWQDLINANGFPAAREKGQIRTEGKEYIIQDGDVIEIKHGA